MKTLTVMAYAINGRGLGHLTRQLAILRWMRRYCGVLGVRLEAFVLTTSEADTLALREGICALKMPSKAMMRDAGLEPARYLAIARTWVLNAVAGLQPDLLLVDTFPAGSFGELIAVLELAGKRALIARPVREEISRENAYRSLLPLYDLVLTPDDGSTAPILLREREELCDRDSARQALGIRPDARGAWLSLGGGGDPAVATLLPRLLSLLREKNWHITVGAGPLYRGPEFRGEGLVWMDRYVPMELFPAFEAAVSAGGYNAFHELLYAGVPTVFLPQPRLADDQVARVEKAVAAGAGRLARTLEEVPLLLEHPGSPEAARALIPKNGARSAAARLLALVLPPDDVQMAVEAFPPGLLAMPAARTLHPLRLLEAIRILAGEPPSAWAARRQQIQPWIESGDLSGFLPPRQAAHGVLEDFFQSVVRPGLKPDLAVQFLAALHRKFPSTGGRELADACRRLFQVLERFQDWPGAVALFRSIPAQRNYPLASFLVDTERWLAIETDLFEAQRNFVRLEGSGARGTAETLRLLLHEPHRESTSLLGSPAEDFP